MKVAHFFASALAAVLSAGAPLSVVAAQAAATDAKVWENYDFVPGNKVIFYTDFSEDRASNFARGLKSVSSATPHLL